MLNRVVFNTKLHISNSVSNRVTLGYKKGNTKVKNEI